jgi:hypothetical protein
MVMVDSFNSLPFCYDLLYLVNLVNVVPDVDADGAFELIPQEEIKRRSGHTFQSCTRD